MITPFRAAVVRPASAVSKRLIVGISGAALARSRSGCDRNRKVHRGRSFQRHANTLH